MCSATGSLAWTVPASLVGGYVAVAIVARLLGPVLSSKGQEATSRAQLVGQIGIVISSKVDQEFGEVRIRDKSGHDVLIAVDEKTGLPASETYSRHGDPQGPLEEVYSDWRETNGVKLPWKVAMMQAGHPVAEITVTDVKFNQGLTPEQISKKP